VKEKKESYHEKEERLLLKKGRTKRRK